MAMDPSLIGKIYYTMVGSILHAIAFGMCHYNVVCSLAMCYAFLTMYVFTKPKKTLIYDI